jgi:hypothetical protein
VCVCVYIYIYKLKPIRKHRISITKTKLLILLKEIIAIHCEDHCGDTLWAEIKSFLLWKKWYIWLPVCFEWLIKKIRAHSKIRANIAFSHSNIQIALTHADDFITSCLQRKQNKSKQHSSFLISLIHILNRNSRDFWFRGNRY